MFAITCKSQGSCDVLFLVVVSKKSVTNIEPLEELKKRNTKVDGEFGSGQGEEKEEAICNWKKLNREKHEKNSSKRKTLHSGIFLEQEEMLTMMRMTSKPGENETENVSWNKSNLVLCFESSFPNHFANVDSQVFDQMQSCCNECPCVDCETSRLDLRRIK